MGLWPSSASYRDDCSYRAQGKRIQLSRAPGAHCPVRAAILRSRSPPA